MYLESAAEREEYVLNKTGLIFRGTAKNPTALRWNFAQVRKDMCDWIRENPASTHDYK